MQRWSETDAEWLDLYVFNEKNLSLQNDFNMMNYWVANLRHLHVSEGDPCALPARTCSFKQGSTTNCTSLAGQTHLCGAHDR